MTEAPLDSGTSKASRPVPVDLYLNLGVIALIIVILGVGAYFAWSVYRDQQADFGSSAAGRLIGVLTPQIRKNPNDAVLRVRLGEAYGSLGKYQQAIEQLNAAIKIEPKHAGAYLDLGMIAMLTNNNATAERYFQKVISITEGADYAGLSQTREQAFYNLGRLMLEEKRYSEAAGFLKGALGIRRDASDTYYQLAHAYQELGDIDGAITQLETALQFDPGFAEAHFFLGELYQQKKDDVNASYQFKQAVDLAPGAEPPRQALDAYGPATDWIAKAKANLANGDNSAAVNDILIARNLDPTSFDAAKLHGQIILQSGDIKGALAVYLEAAKLNPKDAEVQAQIASLQAQVKALTPAKSAAAKRAAAKSAAARKAAAKKAAAKAAASKAGVTTGK
jgi:tetratricopeptide (TPR) repeat protein